MLQVMKIPDHPLEILDVALEFFEEPLHSHRLSIFHQLLFRLLQRVPHHLILILQLRHVLQLRLLQSQNRVLVFGDMVLQQVDFCLQLFEEALLSGQVLVVCASHVGELHTLNMKK